HILTKQSYLYEEPLFLLEKEVSETASYFAIIKTIAHGHRKLGHIAAALAVPQTRLTKYLAILISLDLVERQVPITENNPEKSKKGLYFLTDNFIEFWFKFVYPYRSFIEMGDTDYVLNKIKADLVSSHVSRVFKKVCLEKLWQKNRCDELPFKTLKLGRWWGGNEEIDLVGLNEDSKEALFCECKYTEAPVDDDVFYALVQKAKSVDWHRADRQEYYVLYSKSGFTTRVMELAERRKDLILMGPEDGGKEVRK
ncbi:MAG: ATP-binding protein, partial [Bacillota bacterium]|nr:ATP-binding protein [Bacillota bacterium]